MSSAKNVVARYLTEREVRLAARFRPGDEVKVKPSHGFKEWHGDTGTIEKIIPINKAYVQLKENGRQIFDLDDLEQISKPQAPKLVGVDRLKPGDVIEHEGKEIEIQGWYPTKVNGRSMMGFRGRVVSGGQGFVELTFGAGDKVKLLRRE